VAGGGLLEVLEGGVLPASPSLEGLWVVSEDRWGDDQEGLRRIFLEMGGG